MMKHSALLLAAGGSTRLGRPKQLLTIDDIPLVRYVAQLLLATDPEQLVIVTGGAQEGVSKALEGLDIIMTHNAHWETGMASSLGCGLQSLKKDGAALLIAGTDQPCLREAHLFALLDQGKTGKDAITAYGAEGRGIPVLLTAATQRHIGDLRGDTGLRQIWKNAGSAPAIVSAPELAFDIDTPEQLETAVRNGWIDES
ncbi:nucleotidyltransferase family protein [Gluconobacter kanchanaburiensis]|uniref:4-diphosphocytidyl-2C-methyl-D-erythritol synthase n=1 Tax=Gluconobacter kanchanaburiensis NBRC 103587 TaxID=1307948 RepID=A0A511BBC9_9PROT|nr:nucleotidyltransferase family protein [Gluconobacter kanchanaburiensis]GBR70458.1 hypothetical protein AA103587_1881 [Gluconobacter kanchanaburiensis NBRC 103587]GEK97121.1 4-diphosphocytidyl-2C-methyl-D-erythritol synthase [Gluconobacter kanchanaburiensis NBRC 103587]